ncbi:hypothetical protein AB0H49_34135 [Nocardia sp. NPDC050713]|uniref:hypothetical protein n=1 Tax=Nocardia sp. NPDC050713 TaxID=3154511 RepID=UPI0033DC48BE
MHISEAHRTEVATLSSKAEQIRHICAILGNPDTAEVHTWLEACEVEATRKYVSRIVNAWREEHSLENTGEFRALTAADLAELADLDAQPTTKEPAPEQEPEEQEEIDPATAALAARVAAAQRQVPLQSETALLDVLSDEEMQKERDLVEECREIQRKMRLSRARAELARARAEEADLEAIAKENARNARWHRRALAARERIVSHDAKLAQLYRRAEVTSRALIAVVVIGMIWSGVNVQHNLVPSGDMSDPLYWLSYGIEAMISIPIIVIMLTATTAARWGKEPKREKIVLLELALLAITISLNAGPHLQTDPSKAAEYAIAPIMVGVVIWLHNWTSKTYANLIVEAGAEPSEKQEATR